MAPQRTCDVESIDDFYRYYLHSWVGRSDRDKGITLPFYISGFLDTPSRVRLQGLRNVDGKISIGESVDFSFDELKALIDFGRPDVGMTPNGPSICYLSHSTPREAKKGFRVKSAKSHDFNAEEYRSTPIRVAYDSDPYDWVWWVFNPEYSSVGVAYSELETGKKLGVPLSNIIGLYTTSRSSCPLLAYKRWTIGYMPDPKSISIFSPFALYVTPVARCTGLEVGIV